MTRLFMLALALLLLPGLARAADTRPNYAGHYELADHLPNRVFTLALTQTGSRVHAVFFAADPVPAFWLATD